MEQFNIEDRVKGAKNSVDFEAEIFSTLGVVDKIKGPLIFIKDKRGEVKPFPAKFVVKIPVPVEKSISVAEEIVFNPLKITKDTVLKPKMFIVVKDRLESANNYLPVPLVPKEKVLILSIEDNPAFIKVKHGKAVSIFHRGHFELQSKATL